MERKIKWGVLGYARIARNSVIPAIMKASNAEFYAIASRDEGKLKECCETFGCPKAYNSYDALLEDPEVEAVYIPLPNGLHKEWTLKAAQKGKHILCEKPMAMNKQECLEMIEACKKHKVKLMEAFMYRYTDRIRKVKELLDSGVIGEVRHINSTFRFLLNRPRDVRLDPAQGGGSLYDVGCYTINFTGMITGRAPVSMSAECVTRNGVDVGFSAVLKYDNDVIAVINSGFDTYRVQYALIAGTKGTLQVPDLISDVAGTLTLTTEEGTRQIEVKASERYVLEVEDFSDAILKDRLPLFSLEETVRNMEIIDCLMETVKTAVK